MAQVLRFTSKIGHFEISNLENGVFQNWLFRKIGHSKNGSVRKPTNISILEMIDFEGTLFRSAPFSN